MTPAALHGLRLAELIAALSLATDLGMGQPMAHGLRTCLIAQALGRALGLSPRELANTYFTTLLRFVGCTSDSHELLGFARGDDVGLRRMLAGIANGTPDEVAPHLVRFLSERGAAGDLNARVRGALGSRTGTAAASMTAHCEVASMLAARLGLDRAVCDALGHGFERWDGHGFPDGQTGEAVPIAVRLAIAARDIEVLSRLHGVEAACDALEQRRGLAHDPAVVAAFVGRAQKLLDEIDNCDPWTEVMRAEPDGPTWIADEKVDEALTAFADFADVKTPWTLGHSRGVAHLVQRAAEQLRFSAGDAQRARRAALVHDLGRSGISNAVWEAPGPLSMDQREHVRLHAYYTERVLACCEFLSPLGALAGAHHERLDGSGYHRGSRAADLDRSARLLQAADACQAMMQPRPHRPALPLDTVARELRGEASAGKLDRESVEAVLVVAGARPLKLPRRATAGGLTQREVQVLRLMARGRSNREIGLALGITTKTAGHHVQHIYDKLGCSSRAAAAVFALEHDLLDA